MSKDIQGASPVGDRATHEPSPSVSAVPVDIPSADLFPETVAADQPAPARELDLRTEFLKQKFGLPDAWVWHSFEAIEDRPPFRFAKYEGGVYPFAKTRGKYKGRTDYKRPVPGSERVVVFDDHEYLAWLPTWEATTGKCHQCKGAGQEWRGWDHKEGNKFRDCPRCGATGLAQAMSAREGQDPKGLGAKGLGAKPASAVHEVDAPDD